MVGQGSLGISYAVTRRSMHSRGVALRRSAVQAGRRNTTLPIHGFEAYVEGPTRVVAHRKDPRYDVFMVYLPA